MNYQYLERYFYALFEVDENLFKFKIIYNTICKYQLK